MSDGHIQPRGKNVYSCVLSLLSPFLLLIFTPQKKGGKIWDYFRFLNTQKAATPTTAATATAAMIATSVVIKGVSVDGSGEGDGDGEGDGEGEGSGDGDGEGDGSGEGEGEGEGSGSIGPAGEAAGPITTAVAAAELLYDASPSKDAIISYIPSFEGVHAHAKVP
jgi:hypothetical protein